MKKFIWILIFSLSGSVLAQESRVRLRPQTFADVQRSAQKIRSQEKEIRTYFMQLILRKTQMDIATVLKEQRMGDLEIQKVIDSKAMQNFLSRLEKNPNIQTLVDSRVQKLLAPGAIEAHVAKQRDQMTRDIQDQMMVAQNKLSQVLVLKEKVHQPIDDRTLLTKVWDHLIDDLYKN